ncbi:MAG: HNH endonuclease [Candidatus Bathyarchaeota archaeon]|nr:HNH endonuclease [Candidatus Bathyarchaeota archaeon]
MLTKEDLLRKLKMKELSTLANQNGISLVGKKLYTFGQPEYKLPKKEVIKALLDSPKITKEKIREMFEPTSKKKIRKGIPKAVKEQVWKKYIGVKNAEGKCYVCKKPIHVMDFDVGHNRAVFKGGTDRLTNLRPVCRSCNSSMGTMSIEAYKRKFFSSKRS